MSAPDNDSPEERVRLGAAVPGARHLGGDCVPASSISSSAAIFSSAPDDGVVVAGHAGLESWPGASSPHRARRQRRHSNRGRCAYWRSTGRQSMAPPTLPSACGDRTVVTQAHLPGRPGRAAVLSSAGDPAGRSGRRPLKTICASSACFLPLSSACSSSRAAGTRRAPSGTSTFSAWFPFVLYSFNTRASWAPFDWEIYLGRDRGRAAATRAVAAFRPGVSGARRPADRWQGAELAAIHGRCRRALLLVRVLVGLQRAGLHAFDRGARILLDQLDLACLGHLFLARRLCLREQLPPRVFGDPAPTTQMGHRGALADIASVLCSCTSCRISWVSCPRPWMNLSACLTCADPACVSATPSFVTG